MYKAFLLLVSTLLSALHLLAQGNENYTWEIEYSISIECKNPEFRYALLELYGNKSVLKLKGGDFRRDNYMSDKLVSTTIYSENANLLYFFINVSDTVLVIDASKSEGIIDTIIYKDNCKSVLGHNCNYCYVKRSSDSLPLLNCEIENYGSSDFPVSKGFFEKNLQVANNLVYGYLKAAPLLVIEKGPEYTITITAVSVKKKKLRSMFFDYKRYMKKFERKSKR